MGFITRVVADGRAVAEALQVADMLLQNSPLGVRLIKKGMWSSLECGSLQAAVDIENRNQILAIQTKDSLEAMKAYSIEKRKPNYRDE